MDFFARMAVDSSSELPIYRQLAEFIRTGIHSGSLEGGERLPATRELAGRLGLNRTTISAAYSLLEEAGLLQGQVGRGSFVTPALGGEYASSQPSLDWNNILGPFEPSSGLPTVHVAVNFASSRPAEDSFPMPEFRRLAKEVVDSPEAREILQLGSPYGYPPLRKYLLEQHRAAGVARADDDLIVTNGCQQALDLLARILVSGDTPVLVEDPIYHGLLRVFLRAGANLIPIALGDAGLNLTALETAIIRYRPRVLVVTPEFQNPTGLTLPLEQRKALVAAAQRAGLVLVEIGIYRDLRYAGGDLPSLKELDQTGNVISIGSYSKVAFPGLRVGWVIGPRAVTVRLAEAKQISDLHSDQLSQAVLLRFAESGELAQHLKKTRQVGGRRLRAALEACQEHLPHGTRFTRPEGGMSLWVELPAPLSAEELRKSAEEQGVIFLPGSHFSIRRFEGRTLRLSFGGLTPEEIVRGISILGNIAKSQLAAHRIRVPREPLPALV